MEFASSDESIKTIYLSEVKKLEDMQTANATMGGAQSGITKRTIERQEVKIEKLQADAAAPMAPLPSNPTS